MTGGRVGRRGGAPPGWPPGSGRSAAWAARRPRGQRPTPSTARGNAAQACTSSPGHSRGSSPEQSSAPGARPSGRARTAAATAVSVRVWGRSREGGMARSNSRRAASATAPGGRDLTPPPQGHRRSQQAWAPTAAGLGRPAAGPPEGAVATRGQAPRAKPRIRPKGHVVARRPRRGARPQMGGPSPHPPRRAREGPTQAIQDGRGPSLAQGRARRQLGWSQTRPAKSRNGCSACRTMRSAWARAVAAASASRPTRGALAALTSPSAGPGRRSSPTRPRRAQRRAAAVAKSSQASPTSTTATRPKQRAAGPTRAAGPRPGALALPAIEIGRRRER